MTCAAQRVPGRRRGRIPAKIVLSAMLILSAVAPVPASAEEPLFIRIRPLPEPGSAEAARAAREALWARRQAHARTVIESVCTGCLGAWTPAAVTVPATPGPARDRIADLAAPAGLESDTSSGASEPTPDPSTPERRP